MSGSQLGRVTVTAAADPDISIQFLPRLLGLLGMASKALQPEAKAFKLSPPPSLTQLGSPQGEEPTLDRLNPRELASQAATPHLRQLDAALLGHRRAIQDRHAAHPAAGSLGGQGGDYAEACLEQLPNTKGAAQLLLPVTL